MNPKMKILATTVWTVALTAMSSRHMMLWPPLPLKKKNAPFSAGASTASALAASNSRVLRELALKVARMQRRRQLRATRLAAVIIMAKLDNMRHRRLHP